MVTPARSSSPRTAGNVARRGAANFKNGSAGTKRASATQSRITFFIFVTDSFAAVEPVVSDCALFGPEANDGSAAAAFLDLFVAIVSIIAARVAAVVACHHVSQSIAGAGRLPCLATAKS